MTGAFDTLLGQGAPLVVFPAASRYAATPLLAIEVDGQEVRYLDSRATPLPETFVVVSEHVVVEGERPDTVAAVHIGDAEQWWRICGAHAVLHPDELTATIGRSIRITLPSGFPGRSDA